MKISVTQPLPKPSSFSQMFLWKILQVSFFLFLFIAFVLPVQAQNITIKGRVLNETGQGVPNASVTVKGVTTGVSSKNKFLIAEVGYIWKNNEPLL